MIFMGPSSLVFGFVQPQALTQILQAHAKKPRTSDRYGVAYRKKRAEWTPKLVLLPQMQGKNVAFFEHSGISVRI